MSTDSQVMSNFIPLPKSDKPKLRMLSVGNGQCRLEIDAIVSLDTALDVMNVLNAADPQIPKHVTAELMNAGDNDS